MYIVTSKKADKINGQTATVVSQVANAPIQIMLCISKKTLTHEFIKDSGLVGVSVLTQTAPMKVIGHFGFRSGRDFDKFAEIDFKTWKTGCPLVFDNALAVMEGKVIMQKALKTHTIFVANLISAKNIRKGTAMTYEYYQTVLKGKASENAPTYHCV